MQKLKQSMQELMTNIAITMLKKRGEKVEEKGHIHLHHQRNSASRDA